MTDRIEVFGSIKREDIEQAAQSLRATAESVAQTRTYQADQLVGAHYRDFVGLVATAHLAADDRLASQELVGVAIHSLVMQFPEGNLRQTAGQFINDLQVAVAQARREVK
ncbi:hypothetical protein HY024_01910 [Candidatus Curtissbacteria bacterium]|nr:hypothetical protein [Candidatus Curtissbacteria bacterium]